MRKKIIYVLLSTILLITYFLNYTVFGTDTINGLTEKQNEINTQIKETQVQLEAVQEQLTDALMEIFELNEKISAYELEVKQLTSQLETVQSDINNAQEKLAKAEVQYTKQKKALETRLIVAYEAGETSYLDVLLSSKSISDFISNYYLLSEITTRDTELLDAIERQKNIITEQKEYLENKKEELKKIKDEKEKAAITLANMQTVKNRYASTLSEEEAALQEKIDAYKKEVQDIESEIFALTTSNLDSRYVGGVMAWPVPGYTRITSEFGMRTHPITGVYKLHTGLDIGAPTGANFIAANDGVVIKAGYNSAYGNMVIIDHGGGVSTLYAHGSQIVATLGQTVKRGDIILKVGSTGYSTGPHAHFEVRISGKYVNPINYITTQIED